MWLFCEWRHSLDSCIIEFWQEIFVVSAVFIFAVINWYSEIEKNVHNFCDSLITTDSYIIFSKIHLSYQGWLYLQKVRPITRSQVHLFAVALLFLEIICMRVEFFDQRWQLVWLKYFLIGFFLFCLFWGKGVGIIIIRNNLLLYTFSSWNSRNQLWNFKAWIIEVENKITNTS